MAVQDEVPKSRITLIYKTEVNGEPAAVDLPVPVDDPCRPFYGNIERSKSRSRPKGP